ncbi:MAG: hypothetical protein HQ592_13450 [Planctomycetes bacterium]|nr:hypothetical protein [Planctomycetota bacterium]
MKNLMCRILLAGSLVALAAGTAGAAIIGTFGDFTVFDSAVDTDVTFFDSDANPSPFPDPVTIALSATWPAPRESLTVTQMETYLTAQGLPSNTFLVLFKKAAAGASVLQELNILIGGVSVALGTGTYPMAGTGVFAFDGNIDLSSYNDSDIIQVAYGLNCQGCVDNMDEINLAAAPEPVSMAFLGTGFLGIVAARLRKRRR